MSYEEALKVANSDGDDQYVHDLLRKAATLGDVRAIYALASWHLEGTQAVEKNVDKGIELLKSLRTSDIPEALFDLAVSYDLGLGTRKNSRIAFELYFEAALLGHPPSCLQIAEFFRTGEYVTKNNKISGLWLRRSSHSEREISPAFRVRLIE